MAVPNLVVVFLCVLGAGAVVVVISAFGHHFLWRREPEDTTRDWNQVSPEQESYMKRVREYNLGGIFASVREERMLARQSATTGTAGFHDGYSTYGNGESMVGRSSLHGQGSREVYSGYDSNPSGYNGSQDKNGVWVNERTV